jgi:hypothetical protein
MKKIYLLASALLVGGFAFGQRAGSTVGPQGATLRVQDQADKTPVNTDALRKGSAIWTEDFANGFASTNGTWTQGGTDQIWKHSFATTSGEWSASTPVFAGANASNGFMLFDADSSNFPISPNYLDRAGDLISPSIDLSSENAVALTFESNFRFCCSAIFLTASVSNDGGSSWTDFPVDNGLAVNAASPNPDMININISAVAANQANVQLKFSFSGASHYYWIVDNIQLFAPLAHDLTLTSVNYDMNIEYSMFPLNQVSSMEFVGYMSNQGASTETNVTLDVDVSGTSTSVHTATGILNSLPSTNSDSIATGPTFTPSIVDDYTITYDLSMDSVDLSPLDNQSTQVFKVTDTVYARDDNSGGGNLWNGDDGSGNTTGYEMGPYYDIEADDIMTSITVFIGASTDIGTLFYGVVYLDDGANFIYQDQTIDFTVTAAMVGSEVTLQLPTPINVSAGESYLTCIGHYGGVDAMYIQSGGTAPAQTIFILSSDDNVWYYMTSIPMIRANFNTFIGLDESTNDDGTILGQNYPNPTTGNTTIGYEISSSAQVSLEVFDITGKVVMNVNEGTKVAGKHIISMDVNDLSAGAYNYTLVVDGQRITRTMMISK